MISGLDWGKLWAEHKNRYFEEKELDLLASNGLVPQKHLGPHCMRAHAFSLLEEHHHLIDLKKETSIKPYETLKAITS